MLNQVDFKNWTEVRYNQITPPERRAYHATFVYENKVYVHGGQDLYEGTLSNMWYISLDFLDEKLNQSPVWNRVVPQANEKYNPGALAHHKATVY